MSRKESSDRDVTVNKIKLIRTAIIAVVVLFFLIVVIKKIDAYIDAKKKPALSAEKLTEQLVACSDLTAAEIIYNGVVRFEEDGIPLINENSFLMMYSARVKAGIDISQVKVNVTSNKVIVTLPEVTVQELIIDTDTLEFYDVSTSLFNQTQQSDVVVAVNYAKEDVRKNADIPGLLAKAKEQTEILIRGLLTDAAGDRELIIRYVDEVNDDEEDSTDTKKQK
ncbi:MAG: DUF4230 domain-containing protein [Eubacterium sp.]|nr:DUF4230 domain-containing protein [Eubacterium sp.]